MLDSKGFDLWADGYDKAVGLSDESRKYPFAGYKEILGRIYGTVLEKPGAAVLDVGFGTGILAARLYEKGCRIWGQDFSARMIELAREKMPEAMLVQGDFSNGLSPVLQDKTYDFILSTYALHHLDLGEKISLIHAFLECLAPDGLILIGDIAFRTQADLAACRDKAGEAWDEEEFYFVFEEMKDIFPSMEYEQVSECAGLMLLRHAAGNASGPSGRRLSDLASGGGGYDGCQMPDHKDQSKVRLVPMTSDMYHAFFRGFENDPDLYLDKDSYAPYTYTREKADRYIRRQAEMNRIPLAILYDDEIAGEILIKNIEKQQSAVMSIVLKNAGYKDRGIGTQAEKLAIEYVFRVLDIPTLNADTLRSNTRSRRVLEKVGFSLIHTDKDFLYYRIDREPAAAKASDHDMQPDR